MPDENRLRAVAFQEGDVWVIQGIELDIVAQTRELLDAPQAFLQTLTNTILINRKLGRKHLENIRPAPERFAEMFENAEMELTPTGVRPLLPPEAIPRPDINLRAYREAA